MDNLIKTDLCIIGGGSGGLSVAAGAAQMGAKTVLIEGGKMGGDCLNYGCVPSKAFLSASHFYHKLNQGHDFGIGSVPKADFDWAKLHDYIQSVIASIAPHDSVERFESLGVQVIQEYASFLNETTVQAGSVRVKAKYFIIATGSSAFIPPISGLQNVPYLTNETLFNQQSSPKELLILGGGPIGLEMAQAHLHLGCKVTVLEMAEILPKDDADLVDLLRARLIAEGLTLMERTTLSAVEQDDTGKITATIRTAENTTQQISADKLLIAAGRKPNIHRLNLMAAKVEHTPRGILVNDHLKTTNKRVFAIGDVASGPQFTHIAGYHAGIIIRQTLFKMFWSKVDYKALPWVTYTEPELAQVGLTEEQAREKFSDLTILTTDYCDNDRARAMNINTGQAKVIVRKNGQILGASFCGPQAGDLIQIWSLAISKNLKISAIAGLITPYPTLGEISKKLAGSFYTPKLYSEKTRKIVRFLLRLF